MYAVKNEEGKPLLVEALFSLISKHSNRLATIVQEKAFKLVKAQSIGYFGTRNTSIELVPSGLEPDIQYFKSSSHAIKINSLSSSLYLI